MQQKIENTLLLILMFLILLSFWIIPKVPPDNTKIDDKIYQKIVEADGYPVAVMRTKYGDDVTPKVATTYCQVLPFKRHIADDQIYCYTEVE